MKKERLQLRIIGMVQGVGFRPFIYHLATRLALVGWVLNDGSGVTIEVEGSRESLLEFLDCLETDKPTACILYAIDRRFIEPKGSTKFSIRSSDTETAPSAWILPDLAICEKCRADILDPNNRRYDYPFTNCTDCGPRFTIIQGLPYDRPRTVMKKFPMCDACCREYTDPDDRRFHAQPNACPQCGPRASFWTADEDGYLVSEKAVSAAVKWIREGRIVALKGLGGFHIVVDARNEEAVAELRKRKGRPFKPFAIMYPTMDALRRHVEVPTFAESLLTGAQAPIVILPRKPVSDSELAESVAPQSRQLGVFLPYTPLHTILLEQLNAPVVATSGNLSDEPISYDNDDARLRLDGICDAFLAHDRPIERQADDSVAQVIRRPSEKPQLLRRARGYTPLPLLAPRETPEILALGGQMNVVFAMSRGREIILSQHLGDMEGFESQETYRKTLKDFLRLYEISPQLVVHDRHPGYFTTEFAQSLDLPTMAVQHHHAHLAACMLENQIEESVIGLTWDGTGYGEDGTIWGGEFLLGDATGVRRVGTLRRFGLPGGAFAIRESWRVGLSLLWECYGHDLPKDLPLFQAIDATRIDVVLQMLDRRINTPICSSMGRLFDGVSAILGLSYDNTHSAQSPQLLENAAWHHGESADAVPFPVQSSQDQDDDLLILDWRELVKELVIGFQRGRSPQELAAVFHHSVAMAGMKVIHSIGNERVVLTGGVFCNRYLTEVMASGIETQGLTPYIHSQLPPTDGALAAGQLWVAACRQMRN
jgi:hydrogenase maturation protein HypF